LFTCLPSLGASLVPSTTPAPPTAKFMPDGSTPSCFL
jgi:hypothetical protein